MYYLILLTFLHGKFGEIKGSCVPLTRISYKNQDHCSETAATSFSAIVPTLLRTQATCILSLRGAWDYVLLSASISPSENKSSAPLSS